MTAKLPHQVVAMMGDRMHRMHHYVWHEVRNGWLQFDGDTRKRVADLGWEPPRPARRPIPGGGVETILDNDSGEDFLYMHRDMIAAVDKKLAEIADPTYPKVEGWTALPDGSDPDWPVPSAYSIGDEGGDAYIARCKSPEYFRDTMQPWEQAYRDPAKLRSMTLGELGARVEFTLHNNLHMRFSEPPPLGIRPDVDPGTPDAIDARWDDLRNDWLGDTYSSHVNPVFWKLHGWVDGCIDAWMEANSLPGPVPWKGTWVGPVPAHPPHHSIFARMDRRAVVPELSIHQHDHQLLEVARIVSRSGIACHFYDDVLLPPI